MVRADEKEAQLYARFLDDYGTERGHDYFLAPGEQKWYRLMESPPKDLGISWVSFHLFVYLRVIFG